MDRHNTILEEEWYFFIFLLSRLVILFQTYLRKWRWTILIATLRQDSWPIWYLFSSWKKHDLSVRLNYIFDSKTFDNLVMTLSMTSFQAHGLTCDFMQYWLKDLIPLNYVQSAWARVCNTFNPFPHTGNLQQTTLKIAKQKYGKSPQMMI